MAVPCSTLQLPLGSAASDLGLPHSPGSAALPFASAAPGSGYRCLTIPFTTFRIFVTTPLHSIPSLEVLSY